MQGQPRPWWHKWLPGSDRNERVNPGHALSQKTLWNLYHVENVPVIKLNFLVYTLIFEVSVFMWNTYMIICRTIHRRQMLLNIAKHRACNFFKLFTSLEKFRQIIRNKISGIFLPMQLHPIYTPLHSSMKSSVAFLRFRADILKPVVIVSTSAIKIVVKFWVPTPSPFFPHERVNIVQMICISGSIGIKSSAREKSAKLFSYCREI